MRVDGLWTWLPRLLHVLACSSSHKHNGLHFHLFFLLVQVYMYPVIYVRCIHTYPSWVLAPTPFHSPTFLAEVLVFDVSQARRCRESSSQACAGCGRRCRRWWKCSSSVPREIAGTPGTRRPGRKLQKTCARPPRRGEMHEGESQKKQKSFRSRNKTWKTWLRRRRWPREVGRKNNPRLTSPTMHGTKMCCPLH